MGPEVKFEPFSRDHMRRAKISVLSEMKRENMSTYRTGLDMDDLLQEAYIKMAQVYKQYDPDRGASVETFIERCVVNRTKDVLKKTRNVLRKENELIHALGTGTANTGIERPEEGNVSAGLISEELDAEFECLIRETAEKAAPHMRYLERDKLEALLRALSEYEKQKDAANSVGISKDMMKHHMKDLRKYFSENPAEAEAFIRTLRSLIRAKSHIST